MRRYHGRLKASKARRRWKRRLARKDTSVIPRGPYCYARIPGEERLIKPCPYLILYPKKRGWGCGFCKYLETGDSAPLGSVPGGTFLLWDMCKECGINYDLILP
jgi:hypothetical protein